MPRHHNGAPGRTRTHDPLLRSKARASGVLTWGFAACSRAKLAYLSAHRPGLDRSRDCQDVFAGGGRSSADAARVPPITSPATSTSRRLGNGPVIDRRLGRGVGRARRSCRRERIRSSMRLTTPSLLLVPSSRPLESGSPAVTWAMSWRRAIGRGMPYHPRWSSGSADAGRRQDRRGRLVGRGAGRRLGRLGLDGFRLALGARDRDLARLSRLGNRDRHRQDTPVIGRLDLAGVEGVAQE
jgi:hypothetical protein